MSLEIRRMNRARTLACAALALLATLNASAQSAKPAPAPTVVPPGPGAAPAAPVATPAEAAPAPASGAYTYNPEGRRDPFLSLVGRGSDPNRVRPLGVTGLLINEVSIKGIVKDRSGYVAMIQGPDNKTFVVKAGDRLMDGTVKSIIQDGVVFSQDVNDPLSLVKQKEIRKTLRTIEGGRG
jgi:type IV pilus assembly protein PilP